MVGSVTESILTTEELYEIVYTGKDETEASQPRIVVDFPQ